MKKLLCLFLTAVMLFCCAFSAVSFAETTVGAATQEEELERVLEWLLEGVPEEEAMEIFSWDKDTILKKLEDYDQPLQYSTKEELAEELAETFSMLGFFAMIGSNDSGDDAGLESLLGLLGGLSTDEADPGTRSGGEDQGLGGLMGLLGGLFGGEETAEGEGESFDLGGLSGLLGGLFGGEETAEGEGESFDLGGLSGLLGGLFGGEEAAEGAGESFDLGGLSGLLGGLFGGEETAEGAGESFDLGGLSGLLGGLFGGEEGFYDLGAGEAEASGNSGSVLPDIGLDGTVWENGDMKLEALYLEGYYLIVIVNGEDVYSYLCELNPETWEIVSLGTGSEETDATQPDHGVAAFAFAEDGSLLWITAMEEEIPFTLVEAPQN